MKRGTRRALLVLGTILAMGIVLAGTAAAQSQGGSFRIVRPEAPPSGCLEDARGDVMIQSFGPAEVMVVSVENLPPNTKFDLFLLQLPGRGGEPFGIASYEGDIETNAQGDGKGVFIGRFNEETFVMAPDSGPAPVVHDGGPFPDAPSNPKFRPIHTYHLGAVLRLARGRPARWLPRYGDAVQRGAQGRVSKPFPPSTSPTIAGRCAKSRSRTRPRNSEFGIRNWVPERANS